MAPVGLSFSPDGETIAYNPDETANITLWNLKKGEPTLKWRAHEWYVPAVFFSKDGKSLISGSSDRTVKISDLTGKELAKFDYPLGFGPSRVCAPRLSPNGKLLATATMGSGVSITIQEIPSGREWVRLRGNRDMVAWMEFSPDSSMLISASFDGAVRLWSVTRKPRENDTRTFALDRRVASGPVDSVSLSPDGRHFMTIFTNGMLSLSELPSFKESPRFFAPVNAVRSFAIAAGGKLAGYVSTNGEVVVRREDTGQTKNLGIPCANESYQRSAFSLDGKHFAKGGRKEVAVCDLETGKWRVFPAAAERNLFFLGLSPKGEKMVASYFEGTIKYWDLSKENPGVTLKGHDFQINNTAFTADEKTLISVSHEIHFWDLATGKIRQTLQPRSALFRALAISQDGTRLAVGAADGFINIWDLNSMQEVAAFPAHKRPIMDMRFLPDGNTLVSISVDEVRVWRAALPQEVDTR
jgi:WD40 repeat protein